MIHDGLAELAGPQGAFHDGSVRIAVQSGLQSAAAIQIRTVYPDGKIRIAVDRKVLSDLAITEPAAFEAIVGQAKTALA